MIVEEIKKLKLKPKLQEVDKDLHQIIYLSLSMDGASSHVLAKPLVSGLKKPHMWSTTHEVGWMTTYR